MKMLVALFSSLSVLVGCRAATVSPPAVCPIPPVAVVSHADSMPILMDETTRCLVWYSGEGDGYTVDLVFIENGRTVVVTKRLPTKLYESIRSKVKQLIAKYPKFRDRKTWSFCMGSASEDPNDGSI